MNLNGKQIIAIAIAVLSVLAASTAQLTDLFGAGVAKTVVSGVTLINGCMASVLAVVTSQGSQARDVLDMKGVERILVNKDANKTLAALAMDPLQDKIAPTPEAVTAVAATAKG